MPLAIVDLDFARQQLALTLRARYIHPSGQIPAYLYYGDTFKVECPTGCGHQMNLFEVSREIANRLTRIFLRDEHGRRPVYGGTERFQSDPHWRDYVLFNEYFHGDNGAGLGAVTNRLDRVSCPGDRTLRANRRRALVEGRHIARA